ncbi:S8 family serine peptidase [Candidatus Saccharibacteria bacterium]|nr:S8 family serine peptidase [Candidatus Saccharibacteria bacterium]
MHIALNAGLLLAGVVFAANLASQDPRVATPAADTPAQAAQAADAAPDKSDAQPGTRQAPPASQSTSPQSAAPTPAESRDVSADTKKSDVIVGSNGKSYPIREYKTLATPNDPMTNQWWVATNGMSDVWDIPAGARATKIAVIDTGFALQHEELVDSWAYNEGERGTTASQAPSAPNCTSRSLPLDKSCNGLDDDGNGFVDDSLGWDFINEDATPLAGTTNVNGDGTAHGTSTAGIIAAKYNNAKGTTGVNRYSSILPLQALNDDGLGDSYTVGQSVYYAADAGADVISISLGSDNPDDYLREAVQYALGKGAIVVAASGNDGCDCIVYPANYPEVLAVGANGPDGTASTFSSFGANLDVLAPGESMAAPYWTKINDTTAYASNLAGTSYATPFVSALLGLARSYQPTATWDEITGAMLERANKHNLTVANPRSNSLGFGSAHARNMLQRLTVPRTDQQRFAFDQNFVGSKRAYDCKPGTLPATPVYEIKQGFERRFTISKHQLSTIALQGGFRQVALYSCVGLPTDTVDDVRSVNLSREILNGGGWR